MRRGSAALVVGVVAHAFSVGEVAAQGIGPPQDEPGFHPLYRSTVTVFKTKDSWDQSFTLDERLLSPLQISLSLGSNIQNDSARNDWKSRNSRTNNRVDYYVFRGLSLGVIGELSQTNQTSLTQDIEQTRDNMRLSAELDRVWVGRWRTRVTGQAGITGSDNSSRLRSTVGGSLTETEQTGPSMGFQFNLSNDAQILNADGTPDPGSQPPVLRLRLDVTTDVVQQDTKEIRTEFQADQTTIDSIRVVQVNSNNVNRRASAEVGWSAWRWLDATFTAQRTLSDVLRPAVRQGELERSEQDVTDGGLTLRIMPWSSTTLTLAYRMADGRLGSNLTTSSNKNQTNQTLQANIEFPLFGFDLRGEFEQKTNDDDFIPIPGTNDQADHKNEFIRTRLQAKRDLGSKLSTTIIGDIALNQDFFNENVSDQDRDRQDRTFDITMNYTPFSRFRSRVAFTQYRQRQVNVRPSQAANTNTQERLTVAAGYTLTIASGYTLNQTLNITAQSRVFDFNDAGQSDLTRTNRLDTDFSAQVFPEIRLILGHGYNFRNSGSYALDEDGVRRFGLDREFLEQELNVGTEYKPLDWFSFRGEQELRVVVNRSPGSEGTRNTRYVLELEARARKRLMDWIDTSFEVERVLTTQEEHYWNVSLNANKRF